MAGVAIATESMTRPWHLRDRFSHEDLQVMIDFYRSDATARQVAEKFGVKPTQCQTATPRARRTPTPKQARGEVVISKKKEGNSQMNSTVTQPKAVIFLREQGQEDESCKQTAEALGAQVIREYVDNSYSSGADSIDERPTLRLMLDELHTHDTQYVIVTGPDRLTRRVDVMAAILLEINTAGATLILSQKIASS